MKWTNRFLCFALGLLMACGTVLAQRTYESVEGDPMQARIYTLPNGLKVFLSVNKDVPRIQTYVAVRTGSRNDPAETTGLAHYLEHLMFKGTTNFGTTNMEAERPILDDIERRYEQYRTVSDSSLRKRLYHEIDSVSQLAAQYNIPNEYDKMMSAIGGEWSNAYTSNDVTCYMEDIPSNEVDNWARIQADRFQNMVIRGFHTELETVYEEYNMGLSSDGGRMFSALMAKLFPTHPYGTQTTIGRGEHLKNPSITNIKKYFSHYYVPNNVAICMAGDLEPDSVMDIIEKHFGQWKHSEDLNRPEYANMPAIQAPQDTTITGPEASELCMAWRFPEGRSLVNDTLSIISQLLNNGTAGLIDLDINQQMKAQDMYASNEPLCDYSMFIMGGQPKQGQTLKEVRELALTEMEKLKRGEFSDDLLASIMNNYKRSHYEQLRSNAFRASAFVQSFINGMPWEQYVGRLQRMQGITKEQVVDFARRNFLDNYVCVYKQQGELPTLPNVEKPAITPIPTNGHLQSQFMTQVQNSHPTPIQPVFMNFERDIDEIQRKGRTILYKENTNDDLFALQLRFPLGKEVSQMYGLATDYLNYLGTSVLSNQQQKEIFYGLACDYEFQQTGEELVLTLEGLGENLCPALVHLSNLLHDAQPSQEAYDRLVEFILKAREDAKTRQESNFDALRQYAMYGSYNATLSRPTAKQLRNIKPQQLLQLIRELGQYDFITLFYGRRAGVNAQLAQALFAQDDKPTKKSPKPRRYELQTTPRSEVLLAPYDAKNIYMVQYLNEGRKWKLENTALMALFNEYFGVGMNSIVFQEMREARGLAYSSSASYIRPSRLTDSEYFQTSIITQNDKMTDCIREFATLLDSVPRRETAFELAKQGLQKSLATTRTTRFKQLTYYLAAQRLGLTESLYETMYRQLPAITLQQLMDFARERISHKSYRYIILGDENQLDMPALEKIGPVRRLTTEQIFGK